MHENANIAFQLAEGQLLVERVLSMQPRVGGGDGGKSPDPPVWIGGKTSGETETRSIETPPPLTRTVHTMQRLSCAGVVTYRAVLRA
jgi:hypothetical protein